jgi:hypothetical protein
MPIVVDASSLVRRLHGSIATGAALPLGPPPAGLAVGCVDGDSTGDGVATGTIDGLSVPTATGLEDAAGLVVAEPAPVVEQAASATAVIEMNVSERFVRMRIETSVSTSDRWS